MPLRTGADHHPQVAARPGDRPGPARDGPRVRGAPEEDAAAAGAPVRRSQLRTSLTRTAGARPTHEAPTTNTLMSRALQHFRRAPLRATKPDAAPRTSEARRRSGAPRSRRFRGCPTAPVPGDWPKAPGGREGGDASSPSLPLGAVADREMWPVLLRAAPSAATPRVAARAVGLDRLPKTARPASSSICRRSTSRRLRCHLQEVAVVGAVDVSRASCQERAPRRPILRLRRFRSHHRLAPRALLLIAHTSAPPRAGPPAGDAWPA